MAWRGVLDQIIKSVKKLLNKGYPYCFAVCTVYLRMYAHTQGSNGTAFLHLQQVRSGRSALDAAIP